MDTAHPDSQDIAAAIVGALALYSLAEFQSGHATTVRVYAEGLAFQVSDNGRGHAVDRTVAGQPYMDFVYTHLDFPFAQSAAPPIQLHTIGLSLINTLCSQLVVTAHKPGKAFRTTYRDGHLIGDETLSTGSSETGNTIAGTLRSGLQLRGVDVQRLRQWLGSVAAASPGLTLYFNEAVVPSNNATA
jgi:DNA gyrase/topoisomerase IV subunit B